MQQMAPILFPCIAMVALTAVVWVRMFVERIGEMRARRIRPQSLATSAQARERLQQTNAADNFRNLFEMPVLFYVLCVSAAITGLADDWLVTGAWAYVALRTMHSFIHTGYNRVMHRFTVYALSGVLLFLLWALFAFRLHSVA